LGQIEPAVSEAIEPLGRCLESDDAELRSAAVAALSHYPGLAQEWRDRLRAATKDADAQVRGAAFMAITKTTVDTSSIVEVLMSGLTDESANVRVQAIQSLALLPIDQIKTVSPIQTALEDYDSRVRLAAIGLLGNLGAAAAPTQARIMELLQEEDLGVSTAAVGALAKIATPTTALADMIVAVLERPQKNQATALAVLNALKLLGHTAAHCEPKVVSMLASPDASVRSAAIACLSKIEPDPVKSVPRLTESLRDSEWTVRRDAAVALGELGNAAKSAVGLLFTMLSNDVDSDVARGAIRAIDAADASAVPVLIQGLASDDRRQRYYATFLLGKVGPEAKEALPILIRLRDETESSRFKESFQKAIDAIDPQPSEPESSP
jgi:HEAT repeat protein